jgi:hypothetical protein
MKEGDESPPFFLRLYEKFTGVWIVLPRLTL